MPLFQESVDYLGHRKNPQYASRGMEISGSHSGGSFAGKRIGNPLVSRSQYCLSPLPAKRCQNLCADEQEAHKGRARDVQKANRGGIFNVSTLHGVTSSARISKAVQKVRRGQRYE